MACTSLSTRSACVYLCPARVYSESLALYTHISTCIHMFMACTSLSTRSACVYLCPARVYSEGLALCSYIPTEAHECMAHSKISYDNSLVVWYAKYITYMASQSYSVYKSSWLFIVIAWVQVKLYLQDSCFDIKLWLPHVCKHSHIIMSGNEVEALSLLLLH